MKKTIWTFGLIAGAIMSAMMVGTMAYTNRFGFDKGEVIGYTTMVLAFLLVFFGVRSYRDNIAGGTIGFGRAFVVGLLITVVASLCYTATWEVLYFTTMRDFGTKFEQYQLDRARTKGASDAQLAKMKADLDRFNENYRNPLYNSALTFLEPLPVGLVLTLISAGVLSRRRRREGAVLGST